MTTHLAMYSSRSYTISRLEKGELIALKTQLKTRREQYIGALRQAEADMRAYRAEVEEFTRQIQSIDKSIAETKAMKSSLNQAVLKSQALESTRYTNYMKTSANVVSGLKKYIRGKLSSASKVVGRVEKFIHAAEKRRDSLDGKKRAAQGKFDNAQGYHGLCQTSISRIAADIERINRRIWSM